MPEFPEVVNNLAESEKQFRIMLDAIPQLAWIAYPDGFIFWYNNGWYDYTGTTPEQMQGWGWQSVHDPSVLPSVMERWKESIDTGQYFDMEFPLLGADGRFRWFLTRVNPFKDAQGTIVRWFGTNTDINDKREAEEEIRLLNSTLEQRVVERTEELFVAKTRLQSVLDSSTQVSIIATNAEGIIEVFNSGAEQLLGYKADEVVGKHSPALFHLDSEVAVRGRELTQTVGRSIQGFDVFVEKARLGQPEEREWTYVRKDGRHLTVNLAVTPKHDLHGKIIGFLGMAMDVTAGKEAEKTLRDQALLLDLANDAIFVRDSEDRIIYWNQSAERVYGWSKQESLGQITHELLKTQFPKPLDQIRAQLLVEGHWEGELKHSRRDGTRLTVASRWSLQKDQSVQAVSVMELNYDITEWKETEEELRLSEERFSNAFEYATTGMALVAPDGHWLKVNTAISNSLGYTEEEFKGKTFQEITHPDDLSTDLDKVRQLLEGRIESYKIEKRYVHKDGHIVWALLGVSLLRDHEGTPLYFICQIEDISELKKAMALQEELTTKARAAERAKSEFLAIMSHEIRTPMNGVIGMTSILADTQLDEMQRDYLQTIQTSGESLLTVINDILDYSKIEAGRFQLENRPFNLENCVDKVISLFASQIRIKGLEAVYLVSPDVPPNLIGDALRLRQILVNLIGNAIKFTNRGEIVIKIEHKKTDEMGCHLLISVADTGIGIAKEGLDKLFQAFQQVDTSTSRKYGGTGLGLVISKRLAEFMDGKMWVKSEFGVGSTFFFESVWKVSNEPQADDNAHDVGVLRGHSVLLVDDNDTNRRILEAQLKIWGMIPTAASSGREALSKLSNQKFDVALLDYQMPEMDGIALGRAIHQQVDIPLMLLSSSGELAVGEDATLFRCEILKPITHSLLLSALIKTIGINGKQSQPPSKKQVDSGLAARHPLSILLAEDNFTNQKVGLLMLSRFGYKADLAADGRMAVEAAERTKYDLILMDIQMPNMNGIEACRLIRERMGENSPDIFALTAEAMEGDEARLIGEGFDGYLSKPLDSSKLEELLRSSKSKARKV